MADKWDHQAIIDEIRTIWLRLDDLCEKLEELKAQPKQEIHNHYHTYHNYSPPRPQWYPYYPYYGTWTAGTNAVGGSVAWNNTGAIGGGNTASG